jgi:3,4-dihydroxy 2-butanone 4-phosphate synthase / GTP cyclohydrolase II
MFNKTEELVREISEGRMVILLDDESRENEGDLVFAAKFADKEKISFLLNHAKGLICVPLSNERAEALNLKNMTEDNTESHQTAFTVSVDAANNITTGISAGDRAETIRLLANDRVGKDHFVTPGHMFPLKAKEGGVLRRSGHTEAAVDLVKLAGIEPGVGVICEIIKDDGEMARKDDLLKFAYKHNIKIGTIKDLIDYRKLNRELLKIEAETEIPINGLGRWKLKVFRNTEDDKENIALIKGNIDSEVESILTRVHSECFTGDVLGSEKCDCNYQLKKSMEMIHKARKGLIIYLRQEGRGIGLINKIRAYKLQDEGYDTLDANVKLGFQPDLREYTEAAEILNKLNVKSVKLITNNQDKIDGLVKNNIDVSEQIIIQSVVNENNKKYLETKKERFGHKIVELEMCS